MLQIKILGTGCPKCKALAAKAEEAASALQIPFEIEKVTDVAKIVSFGVMQTPALVVNGEVKCTGRVPELQDMKALLGK